MTSGLPTFSEVRELAEYLRRTHFRHHQIEVGAGDGGDVRWRHLLPPGPWTPLSGAGDLPSAHDTVVICYAAAGAWPPGLRLVLKHLHDGNAIIVAASAATSNENSELSCLLAGTLRESGDEGLRSLHVKVHHRSVSEALRAAPSGERPPLAVLSAFNEADVIEEVIGSLISEDCDVLLLDNWSKDGTYERAVAMAAGNPRIVAERFPAEAPSAGDWHAILQRKEEIAKQNRNRWILHTDADEIRKPPFPGTTLRQALAAARKLGFNRADFTVMNFLPVAGAEFAGALESDLRFYQFGNHASHFQQSKCWFSGPHAADLSSTGGHAAEFRGAKTFPYRFLLQHYPIRSAAHGRRKVLGERQGRWSTGDLQRGWHGHYASFGTDSQFLWPRDSLYPFKGPHAADTALLTASDLVLRRMLRGDVVTAPMAGLRPDLEIGMERHLLGAQSRICALEVMLHEAQVLARDLNAALVECRQQARKGN